MFMCVVEGRGERRKGGEGEGGRGREGWQRRIRKTIFTDETSLSQNKMLDFVWLQNVYHVYKYVSTECVVVTLAMYLHYIFWSAETKVHSIDGESNGRKTVYFTAFKYVLERRRRRRKGGRGRGGGGRGAGEEEEEEGGQGKRRIRGGWRSKESER